MVARRGFTFLQDKYKGTEIVAGTLLQFFNKGIRIDDVIEDLQDTCGNLFRRKKPRGWHNTYLRQYITSITGAIRLEKEDIIRSLNAHATTLLPVVEEYHFACASGERKYRNFYDFLAEWKSRIDRGEFDSLERV